MKVNENDNFYARVYRVVEKIPKGKVMAYSQVAAICGTPRAARAVGWALRALPPETTVPWQRVVNKDGFLTIVNPNFAAEEQKNRLKSENVSVTKDQGLYRVDMTKYLANISQKNY
ncbi:MAG: MGMT family protein [Patescibacteria group bacterium]